MADRTTAQRRATERAQPDREVPMQRGIEITLEQATKRLRRLSSDKLRRVRVYELQHMNRQTVLAAIDGLLAGELL